MNPSSHVGGCALKVSLGLVINQALTTEVPMLPDSVVKPWRDRYVGVEGDEPLDVTEVTNSQLTALNAVLAQEMPPYTDFGVWGPHGNRLARRQKFTNMYVDSGGRWHSSEVAGPGSLESLRSCLAVFLSAAIMLKVATPATLSRYARRFEEKCSRYPRTWYLTVVADDRCRSEFMPAEKRT